MTEPTREQVLEWQQRAALAATRAVGPPGSHNLPEWKAEQMLHLCALAYAAGAREENEACEKLCLTPFPESGTPHSLAFDSPAECADAIRKRRPA